MKKTLTPPAKIKETSLLHVANNPITGRRLHGGDMCAALCLRKKISHNSTHALVVKVGLIVVTGFR